MSTVQVHIHSKKKPKLIAASAQRTQPLESPPSYDEALMLPDAVVVEPQSNRQPPGEHTPAIQGDLPDKPSSAGRERLTIQRLESELLRSDTLVFRRSNSIQEEAPTQRADGGDGDSDGAASYDDDDLAFEGYDDESDVITDPHQQQQPPLSQSGDSDSARLLNELDASRDAMAAQPFKRSAAGWSRPRSPAASVYASNNNSNSNSSSHHALQQVIEKYAAKLEKAEQDKRDTLARHGHQLANYSHELSRLERQLDHAHKLAQEKETELRLQKTRQLYAHGASGGNDVKQQQLHHHQHVRGLLADDFWRDLAPPPPASGSSQRATTGMHTTHIGLAFEQLMSHPLVSLHDHALDASTREWLREVRVCGAQMLQLHRSFQSMSCTFQRLAESSHLYQLAETLARESRELLRAEQALVFVADTAEQEFWCRVPRAAGAKDMITVRSRIMPFASAGHTAAHAMHTCTDAPHQHAGAPAAATPTHLSASGLPSGLASMVYHTKRPLLLDAGCTTKHPCFSTASDNTDRLIAHASASTLLLPVLHHGQAVAVVQLCGKTTVVEALGLSIALEKCEAFTPEDQALLLLLTHFASGLFPKVAYFTDVESNKVNEETLIQLAPEIFTCLRFEELGKIVIQNAKEILDADRCSLFVANNADRTLHNWQSDISGGTVQVYDPSAGPGLSGSAASTGAASSTAAGGAATAGGMTIPFGHGIVGLVAETRQGINIPDAYEDPRFNSSWDKKTHYRTKSMLAVPILTNTTTRQPIRRASHVNGDRLRPLHGGAASQSQTTAASDAELLGVVQVINKSGGAPFRAKDEFLLQTITKLIALAIENSQLFQKNQALCADVGTLIARADLVDATIRLGAAAEAIIGVESAAVYVFDHAAQELVTFHRKRRHKIVVKEPMYRSALLGMAIASQDLVIVNDVSDAPCFNAYVDSIGGLAVRNVLFAPLVVADPDALASGTGTGLRLVGLLHLVNTRGRKVRFERHDLFLSIVASLCCSVVASILAKQALLAQQEQTRRLLDTSMAFFKEMSPVGVINAVYNACTSLYSVEKAHLFLWEPDRRHMWTSKLAPHAESGASAATGTGGNSPSVLGSVSASSSGMSGAVRGGTGASDTSSTIPSLGAQLRRISVLTDQKLQVSTTEGLLEHVLVKGTLVLVKHWVSESGATPDTEHSGPRHESKTSASSSSSSLSASSSNASVKVTDPSHPGSPLPSKHTLRATAADDKAGFVKHAVVACPVWDTFGLEVVGVLVLLFPRGRAPPLSELANLPILCRQIAGALSVCSDLSAVTVRSRTLQSMLELSMKAPARGVSLTLSARGQLVAFSQPLNVATLGFHAGALAASVHASAALNVGVRLLPLAEDGHRWAIQLSAATAHEMQSEHCVKWIGKDIADAPARFDKLRTDLQSVFVRRESVRGVIERKADTDAAVSSHRDSIESTSSSSAEADEALVAALPKHIVFQVRKLLWDFVDPTWRVDVRKACELFDGVDPSRERRISRKHLEHVLSSTGGRSVRLDPHDWDTLHAVFADAATDLVPVERLFDALAPRVRIVSRVAYELVPVLDAVTQTVVSVHVLLTAL